MKHRSISVRTVLLLGLGLAVYGCGDDDDSGGPAASGGVAGSGPAAGGGTKTGGAGPVTSGGTSAGGTAGAAGSQSGGAQSGGAATGGTGGAAGTESGGAETGGAETAGAGGEATGGAETGGAETAGAGGAETGGAETAGAATGGAGGAAPFCLGGTYAFCDDFEDGDSNGWVAINQTSSTAGTWAVATDTGSDGNSTLDFQETDVTSADGKTGYHYQLASGAGAGPRADQTVTVWINLTTPVGADTNKVGICARMSATSNNNSTLIGYCLFLRTDTSGNGVLQLSRKQLNTAATPANNFNTVSGSSNPSGGTIPSFAVGTWYKVALKVADVPDGDGGTAVTLTGYVNDVALITVTDAGVAPDDAGVGTPPVLTAGYAAVVTRSAVPAADAGAAIPTAANFDNVTVTSP